MFETWSAWTWVWLAWGELLLGYLAYGAYLHWRRRQLRERAARRAAERGGPRAGTRP